jgi:hypothetical protein
MIRNNKTAALENKPSRSKEDFVDELDRTDMTVNLQESIIVP